MNEDCPWFNTSWIVQIKPDGTIPERQPGEKDFPDLPKVDDELVRKSIEQSIERMQG